MINRHADDARTPLRFYGQISGVLLPVLIFLTIGLFYLLRGDIAFPIKGELERRIKFDAMESDLVVRSTQDCENHCDWIGIYLVAEGDPLPSRQRPIFRAYDAQDMKIEKIDSNKIRISYRYAYIDIYNENNYLGNENWITITLNQNEKEE